MKILVYGAGAVGGYIGAHLIENGLDVTFIARGLHLHNMIDKGLKIILGNEEKTISPSFASDSLCSSKNVKFDVVIIAVGHEEFRLMGLQTIKSFCKTKNVIFDLTYLFKEKEVDGRL